MRYNRDAIGSTYHRIVGPQFARPEIAHVLRQGRLFPELLPDRHARLFARRRKDGRVGRTGTGT